MFVFDLDGTICFDGHHLPQVIAEVLLEARASGQELAFASARSYRDSLGILGEAFRDQLFIGLNGGLVYDKGQLVYQEVLASVALANALNFCQQHDLPYFLDNHFDYTVVKAEKIPFFSTVNPLGMAQELPLEALDRPTKLVVYMGDHEELVTRLEEILDQTGQLSVSYHEHEHCLYINPAGITKGATVARFCGQNYVAFGNDKNDLDFFERSAYAVQVGDYALLTPLADQQVPAQAEAVAAAISRLLRGDW